MSCSEESAREMSHGFSVERTDLILRRRAPIRQPRGVGDAFFQAVCAEGAEDDCCRAV